MSSSTGKYDRTAARATRTASDPATKDRAEGGRRRLNWPAIIFLTVTPVIGIAGLVYWLVVGDFSIWTVLLALGLGGATGLGITAGYHRLFAHRSYDSPWPVRLLLLLFGGACFEGSAWEWCVDHRRHHQHIDSDDDPYTVKRGFWHAHILWLFFRDAPGRTVRRAPDLWRDPLVRFQHRLYVPLAALMAFGFPAAIAALWGDALGGFLVAGVLRVVINQHFTFAINSVCHTFGKQTYSTSHTARDNWVTALFTYGEGYHNFHHEFPSDYRNGIRFYHWDPTKWLIRLLAYLGLARQLNVVGVETILVKKLALEEQRIRERLPVAPSPLVSFLASFLESGRVQIQREADRVRELRQRYRALQRRGSRAMLDRLGEIREQLRSAELEFRQAVAVWESAARRLRKLVAIELRQPALGGA